MDPEYFLYEDDGKWAKQGCCLMSGFTLLFWTMMTIVILVIFS